MPGPPATQPSPQSLPYGMALVQQQQQPRGQHVASPAAPAGTLTGSGGVGSSPSQSLVVLDASRRRSNRVARDTALVQAQEFKGVAKMNAELMAKIQAEFGEMRLLRKVMTNRRRKRAAEVKRRERAMVVARENRRRLMNGPSSAPGDSAAPVVGANSVGRVAGGRQQNDVRGRMTRQSWWRGLVYVTLCAPTHRFLSMLLSTLLCFRRRWRICEPSSRTCGESSSSRCVHTRRAGA